MRTRGGLTFILVALLLVSSVTTANAVSQSWYLTDDSTGVPAGADYFMDKGSGTGTGDVPIGMLWICEWVPNEPAAVTCDMSGTWKTHIEFSGIPEAETAMFMAVLGVLTEGGGYTKGAADKELTSEDNIFDVDITTSDHEIKPGEYLFLDVMMEWGSGDEEIVVTNGESYISSPGTDPGYPVPELSSLVLFSVGLLAFAGYVLVIRRK